ncbi:MAG: hypothetical protein FJX75_06960 [Armatimonadetes bacterium]|nr:hypothetical protein [Armatimonadota bacterium]
MKRAVGLAILVGSVALSGCVKVEHHVTVRPDAKANTGFVLRLPATMGMIGQMLSQQLPGPQAGLPEGLEFGKREENGETVLEVKIPAELLPPPMASLYKVTTHERLLTKRYELSIDPKALSPSELLRMGQALQVPSSGPAVSFTQLNLGGLGGLDLQSPEGLQKALGMLGDLFGGQAPGGLNMQSMLSQVQMSTHVHMPGRLMRTNGERVDASTAKWLMEPKQTGEVITFAGEALTAESEAGGARTDDLVRRLTEGHGLQVTADGVLDLALRKLVPNPEVDAEDKPVVDADLYSELVTLATGLDATVGAERTPIVMDRLGLLVDQPSLSAATRAAKRLPRLREQPAPGELSVDAMVEALTQ